MGYHLESARIYIELLIRLGMKQIPFYEIDL